MPRKRQGRRPKGEGSIFFHEKRQRWMAQLKSSEGTFTRSAKSKGEASDLLKAMQKQAKQRVHIGAADKITVSELLDQWISAREGDLKRRTLTFYHQTISYYIRPHLGALPLGKLNEAEIDRWLTKLRKQPRKQRKQGGAMLPSDRLLGEQTVRHARRVLRTALNFAVTRKLIAVNPVGSIPHAPRSRRKITPLNEQQAGAFLAALEDHRHYPLFALALQVGMRQAELAGLRWSHVDLKSTPPSIHVEYQLYRAKNAEGKREIIDDDSPKTEAGTRIVPLNTAIATVLHHHKAAQAAERMILSDSWQAGDLVFTSAIGTPVDPTNLRRLMKATLKRADLPDVSFHSLRHSAISIMSASIRNTKAISELVGHSSIAVTEIYLHSFPEDRLRAVEATSHLISPRKAVS